MSSSFPSPSKKTAFLSLAIILIIVFISYLPTLKSEFVQWDDDVHVLDNLSIRSLDREHIGDIFKDRINKIYLPLTTLSFAVEYHYFGFNPFIYHLNNLILHLFIIAFIFWLGMRLELTIIGASIGALIFGIHPIHVESVAWITERKDVLYAFFYMAALLSYMRYLDVLSYRFLVLTTILGVLSMLAKPMALSLPLILLLLDWFKGRKIGLKAILEKLPIFILTAAITWMTYSGHARIPGKNTLEGVLIWPWTFVFYLRQFLFPFFSVPVYRLPHPITYLNIQYLLPLITFGIVVFSVFRLRKYRWFIFSFAFYFLSIFFLLRFDELKDTNMVADRFMYLPSLGFCLLLGLGFERLWKKKIIAIACLIILTAFFSVKTYKQCQIWQNSTTLWEHQ